MEATDDLAVGGKIRVLGDKLITAGKKIVGVGSLQGGIHACQPFFANLRLGDGSLGLIHLGAKKRLFTFIGGFFTQNLVVKAHGLIGVGEQLLRILDRIRIGSFFGSISEANRGFEHILSKVDGIIAEGRFVGDFF